MRPMTIEVLREEDGLCEIYIEYRCLQYGHLKKNTITVIDLKKFIKDQEAKGYEVTVLK